MLLLLSSFQRGASLEAGNSPSRARLPIICGAGFGHPGGVVIFRKGSSEERMPICFPLSSDGPVKPSILALLSDDGKVGSEPSPLSTGFLHGK